MIDDEFSGQGGTYLLDPATGKRTLMKHTSMAAPMPAPAEKAAPAAPAVTPAPPGVEPTPAAAEPAAQAKES